MRFAANKIVRAPARSPALARPPAANNIVRAPVRLSAPPARLPAAASGPKAVRALLGGLLRSGPVILGVGLAAAVELLAPRPTNQGESRWLAKRREDQFGDELRRGQKVSQALSRLSAGLFIRDIPVATLQTERSQLAAAIARRDRIAARQHFGRIAKAMAFDARATNAGLAAVGREIGQLKNAMPPRQLSLSRPKAPGARDSGHLPQVTQKHLKAGRALHAAVTSPTARLPALGQPSAPARSRSSLPDRHALVTHTGRIGTPEEIAAKHRAEVARALQEAASRYFDHRKMLLAVGDEAALAEEIYNGSMLRALGVSLEQFQASLKSLQEPGGSNEARVRASESAQGSANVSLARMPGPAPNTGLTEEPERIIASLPFDTSHLRLVQNGNNGQVGLSVNPDSLGLNPRAAYNKLLREYGETAVMQTMTSLLIPAPGLNPPDININAENKFNLAKVIFNEPTPKMIDEFGEREAENIIGQSLGALVLLQNGLLPSNPENFAAIRNAISDCLAPPEKVVQRYTPPDPTSSIDRAIEDKDLRSTRVSHLSFAALIASMLAKSRIREIIQPKDRPPFFEIQARLLQLLEDEMARISSTRSRPEESPAVKPDFKYWDQLSRDQLQSVITGAQARVFGLLEACGLHVPYFPDRLGNEITEPSYILSAVEGADENSQIDTLISELEYRFKGSLYNLSYHHTGSGPWNDRLVLSIIRHAVSQELILQSSDRAEGPPPQGSFKRWLEMSAEEMRSFLQEPSRQEPIRLWLGLTPEERSIIIERVVREAIDIQ